MTPAPAGPICVIVVAFNAEDFILDCIESVLASQGADVRVVVVDNASSDGTRSVIRDWAAGTLDHEPSADSPVKIPSAALRPDFEIANGSPVTGPLATLTLVEAEENGGFAAGVNIGLRVALGDPEVDHFWILNPDSVATPGAAAAFLCCAAGSPGYGLITGRACYYHDPDTIQIDGGLINRRTGVTGNANVGLKAGAIDMPGGDEIDFAFGGNMVVSRKFVETCGEMPEDYFLYYEEVDWSLRRGDLPILTCQDGLIYHRAGASIGSQIFGGRSATPFSLYFKHRARMMFVRRNLPGTLAVASAYTVAKAAQVALGGDGAGAMAILRGAFGGKPPSTVTHRLPASTLSRIARVAPAGEA